VCECVCVPFSLCVHSWRMECQSKMQIYVQSWVHLRVCMCVCVCVCVCERNDINSAYKQYQRRAASFISLFSFSLQTGQRAERELTRLQLAAQGVRLGSVAIERTGLTLQEVRR